MTAQSVTCQLVITHCLSVCNTTRATIIYDYIILFHFTFLIFAINEIIQNHNNRSPGVTWIQRCVRFAIVHSCYEIISFHLLIE